MDQERTTFWRCEWWTLTDQDPLQPRPDSLEMSEVVSTWTNLHFLYRVAKFLSHTVKQEHYMYKMIFLFLNFQNQKYETYFQIPKSRLLCPSSFPAEHINSFSTLGQTWAAQFFFTHCIHSWSNVLCLGSILNFSQSLTNFKIFLSSCPLAVRLKRSVCDPVRDFWCDGYGNNQQLNLRPAGTGNRRRVQSACGGAVRACRECAWANRRMCFY